MDFSYQQVSDHGMSRCHNQVYYEERTYYGQLQARACQYLAPLFIYGEALFYQTKMQGAHIYGRAVLRDNTQVDYLNIYANQLYVHQSDIGQIELSSQQALPIVYLNRAKIKGVLRFNGQSGIVFADRASEVSQVINGEVKYV
ncbi:hypothetical protein N9C31_00415 [Gammaproteobacteria bacterium]|nr:hypothetical protein [Gammaproteobacteria bacterium]